MVGLVTETELTRLTPYLTEDERGLLDRLLAPTLPLGAWGRSFLPHYFSRPPSRFHRWLSDRLTGLHRRRGTKIAQVAPRGSAKSTWSALTYPLRCAVEALEPYIMLISDTYGQACGHLQAMKSELEDNAALADAYPDACGVGPVWRDSHIRLRNGVVIEALGTGSRIRGRRNRNERPSLIILDDPENDEHITSALQRERTWNWFTRAAANAGTPETNVLALGTALHRDCLVLRFGRTAGWEAHTFRAIEKWPDRMDLWEQWTRIFTDHISPAHEAEAHAYYKSHRALMDAGAELLWPERESLYALMSLRATIGAPAFESEKQGNPVNPEACEWPADYFDGPGFWFEQWPDNLLVKVLSLDPSKGKDANRGDYAARVRIGVDRDLTVYVEADLKRQPVPQLVAESVEDVRLFKPDGFAVEVNQFQELLASEMQRVAKEQQVHLPLYGVNNLVNKLVRIRRLGTYLAQRKLRFKSRSPGTALLVQQLKDFPVGDHDDGPDALEQGVQTVCEILSERRQANATRENDARLRGLLR